jgi:hypothetical protein
MGANLAFSHQTVSGSMELVSGQYFPVLRIQPAIGREITPDDDRAGGGNAVAVLASAIGAISSAGNASS